MGQNFKFFLIISSLGIISSYILYYLNDVQPKPYMDEIFHVKQMQKYCLGRFSEWDPMITTLPGLYFISLGILLPVSWLSGSKTEVLCDTHWLRLMNVLFSICNFCVFYYIARYTALSLRCCNDWKSVITALNVSLLPTLYFFTYLFYTDQGSTFFVFCMYALSLRDHHKMAAMTGAIAVFFRQTNVIWIIFMMIMKARKAVYTFVNIEKKESDVSVQDIRYLTVILRCFINSLCSSPFTFFKLVASIILDIWPYIVVCIGFVAFVVHNGSIVVGAKTDHQAAFNFSQLFYFISFCTVMASIHIVTINVVKKFFHSIYNNLYLFIILLLLCILGVHYFTYVHRYTLADNRHYTFYVWSKLYAKHYSVKYLLIPFYTFGAYCILDALSHHDVIWKINFIVCVMLNIVPSTLLEFRYFIVPFILFRFNMRPPSSPRLLFEFCLFCFVNCLTLYVFLFNSFSWPDSNDAQRFMW